MTANSTNNSSFLTHLVARSFNQADVVQPRFASRFESKSTVSGTQTENTTTISKESLENTTISNFSTEWSSRGSDSVEVSLPQVTPPILSPEVAESTASDQPSNLSSFSPQSLTESEQIQPDSLHTIHPLRSSTIVDKPTTSTLAPHQTKSTILPEVLAENKRAFTALPTQSTELPLTVSSIASNSDKIVTQASNPIDPVNQNPDFLSSRPLKADSPLLIKTVNSNKGNPNLVTHSPDPLLSPPKPLHQNPQSPAPLVKEPEPSPTLRITIGRIDIHANPPTSPSPSRPKPFKPQLSLADYLKSRPS